MSRIRIKNFGPVREGYSSNDGWMDIKKVTLFVGPQGSGKSTVAKAFSTLAWLEKAVNRGDVDFEDFNSGSLRKFLKYQRIHNYLRSNSSIEYDGSYANIIHEVFQNLLQANISVHKNNTYRVPKIMYVPAERNFLSVVKNAYGVKNLPDTLYTFAEELRKGQLELKGEKIRLPLPDLQYTYDEANETSLLIGNDYKVDLLESASGYQSLIPLFLVTKFLTDDLQKGEGLLRERLSVEHSIKRNKEISDVLYNNAFNHLTEAEKMERVRAIDARYLSTCLLNIVEEPEQNLFPESQKQLLYSLLEFNNLIAGNTLLLTSHSPYMISYLTLAVKASLLLTRTHNMKLRSKINKIVPIASTIAPDDLVIYQFDEFNGTIQKLDPFMGLPSDENLLNQKMGDSNDLFAELLEIEQAIENEYKFQ